MAVCSQIHTKHINTLCGQNVQLLTVKPAGKYCNKWAVGMLTSTPLIQGKGQLQSFVNTLMNIGAGTFFLSS